MWTFKRFLSSFIKDEPFVDVMPAGSHPETRSVRGSNGLRIAIHRPGNGDTLVISGGGGQSREGCFGPGRTVPQSDVWPARDHRLDPNCPLALKWYYRVLNALMLKRAFRA
jgi:hypothetical protein